MKCLLFGVPDDIDFDQLYQFKSRECESLSCGDAVYQKKRIRTRKIEDKYLGCLPSQFSYQAATQGTLLSKENYKEGEINSVTEQIWNFYAYT